jgi:anhydro-N-acetylmuramic acid kinase
VKAGGQGAPLIPLYHRACSDDLEKPLAILNIGGVANVTYLGKKNEIISFDTGTGNALIDDFVKDKLNIQYDKGGNIAKQGKGDYVLLENLLNNSYFDREPPKSLDRNAFVFGIDKDMNVNDVVATLTAFTVKSIVKAIEYFPDIPEMWLITGGGRHNNTMMEWLGKDLKVTVKPVEDVGWNGDSLEAEGFAYLAGRAILNLPITLPETTGVRKPLCGGRIANL